MLLLNKNGLRRNGRGDDRDDGSGGPFLVKIFCGRASWG